MRIPRPVAAVLLLLAVAACDGGDGGAPEPVSVSALPAIESPASSPAAKAAAKGKPGCPLTAQQVSGVVGTKVIHVPGYGGDVVTCYFSKTVKQPSTLSVSLSYGPKVTAEQMIDLRTSGYLSDKWKTDIKDSQWGPGSWTVHHLDLSAGMAQAFMIQDGYQFVVTLNVGTDPDVALAKAEELIELVRG